MSTRILRQVAARVTAAASPARRQSSRVAGTIPLQSAAAAASFASTPVTSQAATPAPKVAARASFLTGLELALSADDEGEAVKEKIGYDQNSPGPPPVAPRPPAVAAPVSAQAGPQELKSTPLDAFASVLSSRLRASLTSIGVTGLFPVQSETLTRVMAGENIVVRSRTGSGKTLGFALPIIERLSRTHKGLARRAPRCIILAPTRELALQVSKEFARVAGLLKVVSVYGGAPASEQISALHAGCDIVVGTPGRVQDLLDRGDLTLKDVQIAVLDEADEMLNMGFKEDVEAIFEQTPAVKQSMLWSATMQPWVRTLARKFLTNPVFVDLVGDDASRIPDAVTLQAHVVSEEGRRDALIAVVAGAVRAAGPGAGGCTLVFTETKSEASDLAAMRWPNGITAAPLMGDLSQADRERTLTRFKEGSVHVLCATDIAARGLDISGVRLVVQYRLPLATESFTHRVGRTGRAGKAGVACVLVRSRELGALGALEADLGEPIHVRALPTSDPRSVPESAYTSLAHALEAVPASHLGMTSAVMGFKLLLARLGPERALAAAVTVLAAGPGETAPRGMLTGQRSKVALLVRPDHAAFAALAGGVRVSPAKGRLAYESEGAAALARALQAVGASIPRASSSGAPAPAGPWFMPEGIILELDAGGADALVQAVKGGGAGTAVEVLETMPHSLRKVLGASGPQQIGASGGEGGRRRFGGGGGGGDRGDRYGGGGRDGDRGGDRGERRSFSRGGDRGSNGGGGGEDRFSRGGRGGERSYSERQRSW